MSLNNVTGQHIFITVRSGEDETWMSLQYCKDKPGNEPAALYITAVTPSLTADTGNTECPSQ